MKIAKKELKKIIREELERESLVKKSKSSLLRGKPDSFKKMAEGLAKELKEFSEQIPHLQEEVQEKEELKYQVENLMSYLYEISSKY